MRDHSALKIGYVDSRYPPITDKFENSIKPEIRHGDMFARGGTVRFIALGAISMGAGAEIPAQGGIGGPAQLNVAGDEGAAGGGGSGGSVWIQTASTISGAGNVYITGGIGCPATISPNNNGGDGSAGVFRDDSADAAYSGPAGSPIATPTYFQVTPSASTE